MVNNPIMQPYFLRGGDIGRATLRFPWEQSSYNHLWGDSTHLSSLNVVVKIHRSESGWQDDQECREQAARYCWWLVQEYGTNHLGCIDKAPCKQWDKLPTYQLVLAGFQPSTVSQRGVRYFFNCLQGPQKDTLFFRDHCFSGLNIFQAKR